MSRLVIIDGNAIIHRAYHALPPLTTPAGEPINAVYGFVSMLINILENLSPTHLVVTFDEKEPTFRHKEFEDYQAHRPPAHEDLISQFPKVRETVRAFNIPTYTKSGFEADDVIGTIAKKSSTDEVIIVTGDKDILQLVNSKVKVYLPVRGLSNATLVNQKGVVEKLGVRANQIIDYKALVGDPSDNYKGVPGIGPKTAQILLKEYDSFSNIYKNIKSIKPTIQKKLTNGKKSGEQSLKLAKIVTNVPIKFDLKKTTAWQLNSPEALQLFKIYGFRTLAKRTRKLADKVEAEKQMQMFK